MSINKAVLNGKTVYATGGEMLRGEEVRCPYCGARMHIHRFPGRDDYYFALNPNEQHTSVCQNYEGEKNAPVFKNKSPSEFIMKLSLMGVNERCGESFSTGTGERRNACCKEPNYEIKGFSSINQIIKAGVYYESPFEKTHENAEYRFIDYIIFDRWSRRFWKNDTLRYVGARIVDTRWLGSFSGNENKVLDEMKKTREIWCQTFWKTDGGFKSVRFCLDCSSCFEEINKKLFIGKLRTNGTYKAFVPKAEKLDVLIGANWISLNKNQCDNRCPIKRCAGCLGAYWGKCNSPKQVEIFLPNNLTKNKDKELNYFE